MKKLVLLFVVSIPAMVFAQARALKVVMVVSSYGKDMGKIRPGFEMDEFSQAYHIFKANGLIVDVASPKGGKVEPDMFNKEKIYNKLLLQDSIATKLFNQTLPTSTLLAKDYDAIYVVGGKGPMFDLVVDPSLQDFILEMDKHKAVVASLCHGTIALANIKKGNKYLVQNKTLTGFCNEEETMFGKLATEFPYLLEDRLQFRGAKYVKGQAMLPFMVRDSNYITGQNPYSTTLVAEEIVKALGITPVYRVKYKDEQSMELVSKALLGHLSWAKEAVEKNTTNFDLELIAVYGYYQAKFAKDDLDKLKKAVSIMELVTTYYYNENLYIPLAEYYIKLSERTKAINLLNIVLKKNPDALKAANLLEKLKN